MPGPFMLPKDTREGDWIVIGRQGAYSFSFQTGFNGFSEQMIVEIGRQIPLSAPKRRHAQAYGTLASTEATRLIDNNRQSPEGDS